MTRPVLRVVVPPLLVHPAMLDTISVVVVAIDARATVFHAKIILIVTVVIWDIS